MEKILFNKSCNVPRCEDYIGIYNQNEFMNFISTLDGVIKTVDSENYCIYQIIPENVTLSYNLSDLDDLKNENFSNRNVTIVMYGIESSINQVIQRLSGLESYCNFFD